MTISIASLEEILSYGTLFKQGLLVTVLLSACTVFFGFFLAFGLALMLLSDIYDDQTLDRFIGYCIEQDKLDIKSFKEILRDYNAGKLALPLPAAEMAPGPVFKNGYRDDDPALTRDCSYYEANAMSEVHG